MIRRTKSIISDQLPKKDENVVFCKLSELQTSLYQTILSHEDMRLVLGMDDPCQCDSGIAQGKCCKQKSSDGTKIRSLMFTFMHLLLKVSNHVALLIPSTIKSDWQAKNAKKICIEAFKQHPEFLSQTKEASFKTLSNPKYCGKMKILQGLLQVFFKEHSKVLVFSYSTQVLDILEQYMMSTGYEYRRIDGSVSAKKRLLVVNEFNSDPNIFICLISTKAGGLGLNLTGANRVVIFDPNWNPSHDLQAQDRAYRIGQRRNVSVYRLVSSGTIEENMYLRQIYKQQLLNISIEDENARRYFYAVQGSSQRKGELFGIKNMFALRTGTSSLTADIIKRNERVESALSGYEVARYIPPVLRVDDDDEDLEDVDGSEPNTSTDSELDRFAEYFEEDTLKIKSEMSATSNHQQTSGLPSLNPAPIPSCDGVKSESENDLKPSEPKRSRVTFQTCNQEKRRGKVHPRESRTGKESVNRNCVMDRVTVPEDREEVRFDQTLAGTFNDVTDVFENCGIVHIHENRKVVGGSRAEDHMTRCAISDVYELHQNSQDLAVQCEPLSEESSDEELENQKNSELKLQHNKVRSQVVGKTKILIGQTPKSFRMKQLEKMCQFTKSESLVDFAELVLTSTLEERITMLKRFYEEKDPVYKDIITLDNLPTPINKQKLESKISKSNTKKKHSRNRRKPQGKGASFLDQDCDIDSASQSLGETNARQNEDNELTLDDNSSMEIGIPVTPLSRKRRIIQQSSEKKSRQTFGGKSSHVPVMPSYMDTDVIGGTSYVNIGRNDDAHTDCGPRWATNWSRNRSDDHRGLSDACETDSSALLSQMMKSSQVTGDIDSVDGLHGVSKGMDNSSLRTSGSVVMIARTSRGARAVNTSKPGCSNVKKSARRNDTSILDDLFTISNRQDTKRPPPKTGIGDRNTQGNRTGTNSKPRRHNVFREVDELFSDSADSAQNTESEPEVLLQTSTLKNDDYDCFDDPKLWRRKKDTPKYSNKDNVVDRLIADSDAEYKALFASGKLKRKFPQETEKYAKSETPLGNIDGSESLFSF